MFNTILFRSEYIIISMAVKCYNFMLFTLIRKSTDIMLYELCKGWNMTSLKNFNRNKWIYDEELWINYINLTPSTEFMTERFSPIFNWGA
jgi:hypothetical protein